MTFPASTTSVSVVADPGYYVVTSEEVIPVGVYPSNDLGTGMDCLIEQEVFGQRNERVPYRLSELFQKFGFEWEPLSEPGHMRFLGHAAFMLGQAKNNSAKVANSIFQSLDIPCLNLDGVSLVDPSTPVMSQYLGMTSNEPGLYGAPYEVEVTGRLYRLRQTSCFQKFSACLGRSLEVDSLPIALFEISESFRGEPEESLQLCYRLRRFHLPEAHIHSRNICDSVRMSLQLHLRIMRTLSELEANLLLLISATYEFASSNHDYFKLLASHTNSPALLKVTPPGQMCGDGVEVDVEYKIVDSTGCCRELSTFQIDKQITKAFGIRCDDGTTPSTIHLVVSGSVERYLYFSLDRIVRFQAAGVRRHLPLWISPVVARVVPMHTAAIQSALMIAGQLSKSGVRTELDDRLCDLESVIRDADSLLVPYLVLVGTDPTSTNPVVSVREFRSGFFRDRDIKDLIAEIDKTSVQFGIDGFQRLSRQHFNS